MGPGRSSAWSIAAPSCSAVNGLTTAAANTTPSSSSSGGGAVTLAQRIGSAGVHDAGGLGEHRAGRRRRLDHQQVGALQLCGRRHLDEDRLVAEAGDHALQHATDLVVGLADEYLCHMSMIDRARWISGGRTV